MRVRYLEGEFADAEPLLKESAAGYGKDDGWRAFYAECVLGANQIELRKYADAERHLTAGFGKLSAAREAMPFENRPEIARIRQWIAQLYDAWGKTELAARWRLEQ